MRSSLAEERGRSVTQALRLMHLHGPALPGAGAAAAGFSSGHLTRYEADRRIEVHGDLRSSFDGIFEVQVPSAEESPTAKPLELAGQQAGGLEVVDEGQRRAAVKRALGRGLQAIRCVSRVSAAALLRIAVSAL